MYVQSHGPRLDRGTTDEQIETWRLAAESDFSFWAKLRSAVVLFKPIAIAITFIGSDAGTIMIDFVFPLFEYGVQPSTTSTQNKKRKNQKKVTLDRVKLIMSIARGLGPWVNSVC